MRLRRSVLIRAAQAPASLHEISRNCRYRMLIPTPQQTTFNQEKFAEEKEAFVTREGPPPDCNLPCSIYPNARPARTSRRGHSSVGRAPALQAGSQGFESPCLQSRSTVAESVSRVGFGVSPKLSLKSPRTRDGFASTRDACATRKIRVDLRKSAVLWSKRKCRIALHSRSGI